MPVSMDRSRRNRFVCIAEGYSLRYNRKSPETVVELIVATWRCDRFLSIDHMERKNHAGKWPFERS